MQKLPNRAEKRRIEPMMREEGLESEEESCLSSAESEKRSSKTNFRYKRYNCIWINPIGSQSSSSDGETAIQCDAPSILNIPPAVLRQSIQAKKQWIIQKRKAKKKAKKEKKKVESLKKAVFLEDEIEWDSPCSWDLPQECVGINRTHKENTYNQLRHSILTSFQQKSTAKYIFLTGPKDSAKKTILLDVLQELRSTQSELPKFKQLYLTFEEEMSSNVSKKLGRLCQHLKTDARASKSLNQLSQTAQRSTKLQTIIILDDYRSFIFTLQQSSSCKKIKKLIRKDTNHLFIFIDSNITKKEIEMLNCENYSQINIIGNTKQYFQLSLTSAVNNYPYRGTHWQITAPLANYLSTKMGETDKLRLSIIPKLILFLENLKNQAQPNAARTVTRDLVEQFMQKYVDRTIKIDLKRLTIQEKAVLTACYLCLKEKPQIYIPMQQLYKNYSWVCTSICVRAKPFKEFLDDILFQLSIYKLVRVDKGKNGGQIMLNTEAEGVRTALREEPLLAKFYKSD